MTAKRFCLTLLAACLTLSLPEQASAFYAPHVGRFTSRDPNGETGRIGLAMPPDAAAAAATFVERDRFDPMAQYDDGMNLYQYVGGNPLIRTDPSGLLFGWNYGNYCGWSRRGPGKPIDALDKACQDHDDCHATWWTCNPYHLMTCSIRLCLDADAAADVGCAASYPGQPQKIRECQEAARQIGLLFCTIGFTNPERDFSNPWWWVGTPKL